MRKQRSSHKRKNNKPFWTQLVLSVALLLVLFFIIRLGISGKKSLGLKRLASYEEKLDYIQEREETYPENFRSFAQRYPEAIDFVLAYPDNNGKCPEKIKAREEKRNGFPLYIQWDHEWGYCSYNENTIGTGGCGPTAFAILYAGMSGDYSHNPLTIARYFEEHRFAIPGLGTSIEAMTKGAEKLGLQVHYLAPVEAEYKDQLEAGRPLIVNVGPGIFTTGGHYMVIDDYEEGKGFSILDPNSPEKSDKYWPFDSFQDQVKFTWAYEWASMDND